MCGLISIKWHGVFFACFSLCKRVAICICIRVQYREAVQWLRVVSALVGLVVAKRPECRCRWWFMVVVLNFSIELVGARGGGRRVVRGPGKKSAFAALWTVIYTLINTSAFIHPGSGPGNHLEFTSAWSKSIATSARDAPRRRNSRINLREVHRFCLLRWPFHFLPCEFPFSLETNLLISPSFPWEETQTPHWFLCRLMVQSGLSRSISPLSSALFHLWKWKSPHSFQIVPRSGQS